MTQITDKTKDGRVIRWEDAARYAERLASILGSVGFTAPEYRQREINVATALMTEIAEALCLSRHTVTPEVIRGLTASSPEAKGWLDMMTDRLTS